MVADWHSTSRLVAACILTATILAGCSETMPLVNLPDIAKLPEKVLTKDQQQKAMNQMIEKGQAQQSEAAKQIDRGK
jgi:outer membrane murein-binding lipoprotein Lpp